MEKLYLQIKQILILHETKNLNLMDFYYSKKNESDFYRVFWLETESILDGKNYYVNQIEVSDHARLLLMMTDYIYMLVKHEIKQSDGCENVFEKLKCLVDINTDTNPSQEKCNLVSVMKSLQELIFSTDEYAIGNMGNWKLFLELYSKSLISFESIYVCYVARSVLSDFKSQIIREKKNYTNIWGERKDIEVLMDIVNSNNINNEHLSNNIYQKLMKNYKKYS